MEARYSGDRSLQHPIEPKTQKKENEVKRRGYKAEPARPRLPSQDQQRKKDKEAEKPEVKQRGYTGSYGVDKAEPVARYPARAGAFSPGRPRLPLQDQQRKKDKEAEKPEVKQRGYTGSYGVDKAEPVRGYPAKAGAFSPGRPRLPLQDQQRKKDKEAEKPEVKQRGYTGSYGVDNAEPVIGYPANAGAFWPPPIQGHQTFPPAYSQDIGHYPSCYYPVCHPPNQGYYQTSSSTYYQGCQQHPPPPNQGYYQTSSSTYYQGCQQHPPPPNQGCQQHPPPSNHGASSLLTSLLTTVAGSILSSLVTAFLTGN